MFYPDDPTAFYQSVFLSKDRVSSSYNALGTRTDILNR